LVWLRRLLPDREIEIVCDSAQRQVFPDSIVVCGQPSELAPELLNRISNTPGIILYHAGDEWYSRRLDAYACFAQVIRNHFHTGLQGSCVAQFPLGPCRVAAEPCSPRAATERNYLWSFVGQLASTRRAMLRALRDISPNRCVVTGGVRHPQPAL